METTAHNTTRARARESSERWWDEHETTPPGLVSCIRLPAFRRRKVREWDFATWTFLIIKDNWQQVAIQFVKKKLNCSKERRLLSHEMNLRGNVGRFVIIVIIACNASWAYLLTVEGQRETFPVASWSSTLPRPLHVSPSNNDLIRKKHQSWGADRTCKWN